MAHFFALAFAELTDGAREQPGDVVAERRGDLRCTREQEVAREDRLQVAPLCVHGLDATALGAFVHHVVVVERTEVDELTRDAAEDHLVGNGRLSANLGGGHRHHRAQALAARHDEVGGDFGEVRVPRAHGVQECGLDAVAVGVHGGKPKKW